MKKLTQMAMFVFAIFYAQLGQAQQVKILDKLPSSLPIGDERTVVTWIVTNRPSSMNISLGYKDASGQTLECQTLLSRSFKTYQEFIDTVISSEMDNVRRIRSSGVSPDTDVYFGVYLNSPRINKDGGYDYDLISASGLVTTDKKIGKLRQVTPDSFRNLEIEIAEVGIAINNLEAVSIEREGEEPWSWKNGEEPFPAIYARYEDMYFLPFVSGYEYGPPYILSLSFNEVLGKNKVRITLKVSGQTATYTQHGTKLVKRVGDSLVVTPTGVALNTSFPQGADVRLESSPDLINWSVVNTFQFWNTGKTSSILDIPTHSQYKNHLFFRTVPE